MGRLGVPAVVRAKAADIGAGEWLDRLPALVGHCARAWDLRLGAVFGDATEAYVVAATRADGTPAVLKLLMPGRGAAAAHEITVLRLAGGRGCVRLLEYDVTRGALLLERLGPAMSSLGLPQPRRLEILCDLAVAVWRPVVAGPFIAGSSGALATAVGLQPVGAEMLAAADAISAHSAS